MNTVKNIRDQLAKQFVDNNFIIDKLGTPVVELLGVSFIADEPSIFGKLNEDYIERELEWYKSQSLFVEDIPGKTPAIWEAVSSVNGEINSNYGWCIWSEENHEQYNHAFAELKRNPDSRRAIMIYTRPNIQVEYKRDGMSDFICTNTVQYLIRDNKLVSIVNMRSNDAWAGYRNDYAWQSYVADKLAGDLGIERGDIIWQAGSLHVYSRQFYLIDNFIKTGEIHIDKPN